MDDELVTLYLRLGRYGSQTGVGLPLLQCWVPLSVCFSSVLAWIGFAVARNKDACPSHPRVLESDRTPAFLLLLLLRASPLLLLLLLHCLLVLLGVLFLILILLRKLYDGGCCTEPSEKYRVRI